MYKFWSYSFSFSKISTHALFSYSMICSPFLHSSAHPISNALSVGYSSWNVNLSSFPFSHLVLARIWENTSQPSNRLAPVIPPDMQHSDRGSTPPFWRSQFKLLFCRTKKRQYQFLHNKLAYSINHYIKTFWIVVWRYACLAYSILCHTRSLAYKLQMCCQNWQNLHVKC